MICWMGRWTVRIIEANHPRMFPYSEQRVALVEDEAGCSETPIVGSRFEPLEDFLVTVRAALEAR